MKSITTKHNALTKILLLCCFCLIAFGYASADQAADDSTGAILQRFAADYQKDISLKEDVSFGIQVDGQMWTVECIAPKPDKPAAVSVEKKSPLKPTYYFTIDHATLLKLDRGELNAKTAMAKAFESDKTPMDIEVMEGFQPPQDFTAKVLDVTFHFWTRGFPEIIAYGDGLTRFTHGADVTIFYYQPGLRSGWGSLKKGMHANEDPKSQVNEFPTLIVVTSGKGMARIGGKEVEVQKGQAVFIPKGVAHEFWNDNDAAFEIILIMFGEGA